MVWFETQRRARSGLSFNNKGGGSLLGATNPATRRYCRLQEVEPLLNGPGPVKWAGPCIFPQKEGEGEPPVDLSPVVLCRLPGRVALFDRRRHHRHHHSLDGSLPSRSQLSSGEGAIFHLWLEMGSGVFVFDSAPIWFSGGSYVSPSDYFVTHTTRQPDFPTSLESERID